MSWTSRSGRWFRGALSTSVLIASLVSQKSLGDLQQADDYLTAEETFRRCYSHLTGDHPSPLDPRWEKIRNNELKPIDACLALLEKAELKPNGELKDTSDTEAQRVLRTFHSFHSTWFQYRDFPLVTDRIRTMEVIPVDEPALHVSRTLFQPGIRFDQIVTGNKALVAIRKQGDQVRAYDAHPVRDARGRASSYGSVRPDEDNRLTDLQRWTNLKFMAEGELVGIRSADSVILPFAARRNTRCRDIADRKGREACHSEGFQDENINIHQNYGGGILGSPSYLMQTLQNPGMPPVDGGPRVSRRFAKGVYGDLFCRSLPVVDLKKDIENKGWVIKNSNMEFRKDATCMSCHSSMDTIPGAVRNLVFAFNFPVALRGARRVAVMTQIQPTLPSAAHPTIDADNVYERRPAEGRIYFRSHTQGLIDVSVNGPQGLGEEMAKIEDLYTCAAKRYVNYFTGIDINLDIFGDQQFSKHEKKNREWIFKLGQKLKTHQSLSQLMKDILRSDVYVKRNFGVGYEQ